jgi:hypothetical protein
MTTRQPIGASNDIGPMARHRVGLALPAGMGGRKPQWSANHHAR